MAYELKLPDLGEGLTEGEVARWLVREGQEVREDDPLVEIQTDKATVEIPSPVAGTVAEIRVAEGEIVPVGTVLLALATSTSGTADAVATAGAREERVRATPLVRNLARELGVALEGVSGTGPQGRITEQDVRAAAAEGTPAEGRRVPLRGTRRRIAQHLATAHREIPSVTCVEECDFSEIDLTLLVPLVLRATAQALREFPELNARLDGDEIVLLERYDLGLAVQTDDGLVVPVVRGCDTASLEELRAEAERVAEAARSGTLRPEELRGSTFTVTSAGKLGGLFATPLINHPEVAILGVHRIGPRPVVRDGEIAVRSIGNISVTFDHRVVDGARAAAFLLAVIERLERGG
jgi:pyruvate dehydrogenase E2 component (dihydrolipoamide acetyltransferase)